MHPCRLFGFHSKFSPFVCALRRSDIRLDVYDWVEGPSSLETRWRFSALLDLPWKPRLAAAGGTTHVIDMERGLVVRHEERCGAGGFKDGRAGRCVQLAGVC